jgi:hypothetical protein
MNNRIAAVKLAKRASSSCSIHAPCPPASRLRCNTCTDKLSRPTTKFAAVDVLAAEARIVDAFLERGWSDSPGPMGEDEVSVDDFFATEPE